MADTQQQQSRGGAGRDQQIEAQIEDAKSGRQQAAEPPAGGRQDHDAMRAAAMTPVTGPASTDTLAAGGGLEVPGSVPRQPRVETIAPAPEPIPGERDPHNLTHRQPGAIGGQFSGGDTPSPQQWLDEDTANEHAREGGGKNRKP